MDCKTARKLIPAFVDDELRSDSATDLRRHLESCRSCREEMASVKRTMDVLGSYGDIEPKFSLTDIRERAARRRSTIPAFGWLCRMPRLATAVMVFAALAVGAVPGIYYGSHRGATSPARQVASKQVSDSFGLDAFDNGLSGAVYIANAKSASDGGVTR